jgi:hypothetical protein
MTPLDVAPAFLEQVRHESERVWADPYPGLGWQPETRWRGGLSDAEIAKVEKQFGLAFPPDYRLFLRTLHTTDPERVQYVDGRIQTILGRPFHDWQGDRGAIEEAMAWPLDGLLWSVEADVSWTSRWGDRSGSREARAARVRHLAQSSPPLIPLMGHRYLVGHPLESGNPVLSIYGTDVVVCSPTFTTWLVDELASMVDPALRHLTTVETKPPPPIPFWQDVMDDEGWSREIPQR